MRPQVQILLAPHTRRPPADHGWGPSVFRHVFDRVVQPSSLSAVVLGSLPAAAPQATAAEVSCSTNVCKRTFYKSTSFSGSLVKTDCDNAISQSWSGSPVFGVRVYLDGVRKIDLWKNTGDTARSKSVNLTAHPPRRLRQDEAARPRRCEEDGLQHHDPQDDRLLVRQQGDGPDELLPLPAVRRLRHLDEGHHDHRPQLHRPLVNPDDRTPYSYEVVRPLPVVTELTGAYDKATGKVSLKWRLNIEPHFDHSTVLSNDKVDGS